MVNIKTDKWSIITDILGNIIGVEHDFLPDAENDIAIKSVERKGRAYIDSKVHSPLTRTLLIAHNYYII